MSHPVEQDYSTTMSPVDPMRAIIQHQFPDRTHHSLEAHPGHWTFDSSAGLPIQHQPPDHAGMMMTLQPQRASPDFSSVLLFLQQQQQQQQQLYCQMMMMNHPQQYFGPSVPNAVSFRRPSMGSEASSVSVTVSATKNEQWSVIAGASVLIDKPSANKVTTALSGLELGRYACTAKGEWLAYYTEPHHGYRIFRCKCEGSAKIKALSGDTGWQLLANQGEHAVAAAAEDEDTNAATHLGLPAHIKALLLQIVVECPTIAPHAALAKLLALDVGHRAHPGHGQAHLHQRIRRHISYLRHRHAAGRPKLVTSEGWEHLLPRNSKLSEIPKDQLFIGMVPLSAMEAFLRIKKELVVRRDDTLLTLDQLLKKQVEGNKFQRIGSSNTDQNQGGMFHIPLSKAWKNELVKDRAVKALLKSIARSLPLDISDYSLDARFLVTKRDVLQAIHMDAPNTVFKKVSGTKDHMFSLHFPLTTTDESFAGASGDSSIPPAGMLLEVWPDPPAAKGTSVDPELFFNGQRVSIPFGGYAVTRGDLVHAGGLGGPGNVRLHISLYTDRVTSEHCTKLELKTSTTGRSMEDSESGRFRRLDTPPIIPMWHDGNDQAAGVWRKWRNDMLTTFKPKVGEPIPPYWKHLTDDGPLTRYETMFN
jgi:hypothetical protein